MGIYPFVSALRLLFLVLSLFPLRRMLRFLHVPPNFPTTKWSTMFGLPWWRDQQRVVGKVRIYYKQHNPTRQSACTEHDGNVSILASRLVGTVCAKESSAKRRDMARTGVGRVETGYERVEIEEALRRGCGELPRCKMPQATLSMVSVDNPQQSGRRNRCSALLLFRFRYAKCLEISLLP